MARCIVLLGLLCGSLGFTQTANAQGLWFGGFGFGPGFSGSSFSAYGVGGPGPSGGLAPVGWGYPMGWGRVSAARPVVAVGPVVARPVSVARPAVALPLNRAYRRIHRRGW